MRKIFALLVLLTLLSFPGQTQDSDVLYQSESLVIRSLSASVYVHTSYLHTETYGQVACNGMIFIKQGEAAVFDTPNYDSVSTELIRWIEREGNARISLVVPTHFHIYCLGGLEAFHQEKIPSLANQKTLRMAKKRGASIPQKGFRKEKSIRVGNQEVILKDFGPGHTMDNIIVYIPGEETLFGGCLIKTLGAGKGNLADADVDEWPRTISRIQSAYPGLQTVVPGHGKPGGTDLLDYTFQLFSPSH
jgi:metallo-beta-lactamase class B